MSKENYTSLNLPKEIIEEECSTLLYCFPEERLHITNRLKFAIFNRTAFDQVLIRKVKESEAKFLDSALAFDISKCF